MSAAPQALALAPDGSALWQRAAVAVLLCWLLIVLLYRQTAWSMVQIWLRSDTFAHGLLVLPLSLWLVWRKRQALAALVPAPLAARLPLVALCGACWLLGELATVNALAQAALVALLVLAVAVLLGQQVARCLAFPLAFLFFAVPVGEFLLPQLMEWTANFTVFALRASGIPVLRAGNSFVIPSGNWSVVEACSGVRYLIASFMLGTLFAYLNYRSLHRRLLFVAVSILVPVLANWMRAYLIVLLGHLSGNRFATGVDHVLYGWLFFGLVIALMFVVGARWAEPQARTPRAPNMAQPSDAVAAQAGTASVWAVAGALVLLAALPHLALSAMDRHAQAQVAALASAGPSVGVPELGSSWPLAAGATEGAAEGVADTGIPAFEPAYQHPSRVWQGLYGMPGHMVGLYVALYQQQGRGHTLVGSGNALVASNDPHWTAVAHGSHLFKAGGQNITLRTTGLHAATLLQAADPVTLQVWQLYWVHGHVTASDFLAKAYSAWSRLRGQRDDAAVLLVYAPTDAALASFWSDNYATLNAWLFQQEAP